ncbi:9644_t:CDS:1, partial [Rhizophagus irregularis]
DIIVTGENQEVELQSVSSNSLLARIFQDNVTHVKVANYLALPKIHHDDCPLTWWKTNKTRFLVLSKLARKYLAIPATSTLSEKLFSEAGNVMTIKRTQLAPNMLENLVFCKKNELAFGWRDFSFKY